MESLEERIKIIEARNSRVDLYKKWETSFVRIFFVSFLTYAIVVAFLFSIHIPRPFLYALIPVFGLILSTQSLPFIKKIWIKKYEK